MRPAAGKASYTGLMIPNQRTVGAVERYVRAILPHTCFTVNTHILRWRAGKGQRASMISESVMAYRSSPAWQVTS